jgi:hypothetical protein
MAERVMRMVPEDLIDRADLLRQMERRQTMYPEAVANDSSEDASVHV